VAQYLAVQRRDAHFPKDILIERYFEKSKRPAYSEPNQLHRVLAELPFEIYVTTNYDDFMTEALQSLVPPRKHPRREICRWNSLLRDQPSVFDNIGPGSQDSPRGAPYAPQIQAQGPYEPIVQSPVVFHLHGHHTVSESLVLTEDDYLDFLMRLSRDDMMLPARIQKAFRATSLLFIGYSLNDWNFRVLFRGLNAYVERGQARSHVSVQLLSSSDDSESARQKTRAYLSKYFRHQSINVYWGSCADFARELRERWEQFAS
jgi:hypothetical protein